MVRVAVKQLQNAADLPLPYYATEHSAGMDLMAAVTDEVRLKKGEWKLIPTGLTIALPDNYEAQVRPRSGLALKNGITVLNSPGTIDADYRGEIGVILINLGQEDFVITRGMRVAQIIFSPVSQVVFNTVCELPVSARGEEGFGSTGNISQYNRSPQINQLNIKLLT